MPRVLLVGAFGQGNPGDEALCRAVRDALADCDLVVASSDPDDTAARHACAAIPASAGAVARAVHTADVVVIGGGTIFKALHPTTGRRPNALLRTTAALVIGARAAGTRVALVGVGADELHGAEARFLAQRIVRGADLLVLRDDESAAALTRAGLPAPFRVGADAAWALLDGPSNPTSEHHHDDLTEASDGITGQRVTVAISHLAGDDRMEATLARALAALPAHLSIRLQPWQTGADGRDLRLAESLRSRLADRANVAPAPADLVETSADYAADRLVIALRFHAAVAAGAAGTPFLAIAHEPKLGGLARRLAQPSVPPTATEAVLARAIDVALRVPGASPSAVRGQIALAEEGFGLLHLLVHADEHPATNGIAGLPLSSGSGSW